MARKPQAKRSKPPERLTVVRNGINVYSLTLAEIEKIELASKLKHMSRSTYVGAAALAQADRDLKQAGGQ